MENNLIKNETEVYYTVLSKEGVTVSDSYFSRGELKDVQITRESSKAKKYPNKEVAQKVAAYIDGKIIKHTRTEIITEVTEELKLEGEN